MTPERWQQAKEIFHAALERSLAERSGFLSQACGADEALHREVESLLASHEKDGSFIDSPAYEAAADMLTSDQELKAGQTIGQYEILSTLGKGGMGEVYLARDTRLGRKVALKFLPSSFTKDRERLRRFEQEARAASALNHPNILTIHEIGEADGHRFIATEFVDGETLRPRILNGPLGLGEALSVAEQAASALAAAHAAGIVHRDIKPENIMLRRDGIVKVLDFGLAKLAEQREVGAEDATRQLVQTSAGVVMGTVAYMSPEQARGLAADARTDIWSLGVVLYEMLTGRAPFEGPTTSDLIVSVLEREPPPLGTGAETPAELQRIVAKMLRKDREERYQGIRDLLLDLKSLREEAEFEGKLKRSTAPTRATAAATQIQNAPTSSSAEYLLGEIRTHKLVAILALLVLTVGIAALYYFTRGTVSNRPTGNETIDSIAVLPLVNASQDPNAEYLSDGIAESVINNLSQITGLRVMPRNSAFRFKSNQTDTRNIAAQLSVEALVTGDIKQIGDKFVINVRLIEASDDSQIWGDQYIKTSGDIIAAQNEIAQAVAQNLRLKLTNAEQQQFPKNYTENAEAYQLYLRGRYHYFELTEPEIHKSIDFYQQAIDIDPTYALAYAGIADAYRTLPIAFGVSSKEAFPQAKEAAKKALAIAPNLAEAHIVLGWVGFFYDWDWSAAESELKKAIELAPNNADAHRAYAHLFSITGRHDKAVAEGKRARELDPLSLITNALEGQFLFYAGREREAIDRLQKTLEIEPKFWIAHNSLGRVYLNQGRFEEAIAEFNKARELSHGGSTESVWQMGYALAKSGNRKGAQATLEELRSRAGKNYVPAYSFAMIYNGLGKREEALKYLEKSFEQREVQLSFIKIDTRWNNLRSEPRFIDLMRRVGFTP